MDVEVLDLLRIEAMPVTFELAEDASTQIRVSLNRIDAVRDTVTVTIKPEGSGLTVSSPSLTFSRSSLGRKSITVDTTTDSTYTGDRSATLTFTATDYATATVIVTILENTPQPIGLEVMGPTELGLVRFSTTDITVSVDVDATLNVETTGAVRLADGRTSAIFTLRAGETQIIQIERSSGGEGSVTFALSGVKEEIVTTVVKVTVSTPRLVITEVSPSNINLLTRETTVVTVRVNAVGNPNSTLTATVTGTGISVTPTEIIGVRAGTATTFTVTAGLDAGNTTLTLTARHPLYDLASMEVDVRVDLPRVGLSVEPSPLKVVIGTSTELTIEVSAMEGVTLTVTVDRDDRIRGLADEYLLMNGETSTTIEVIGNAIGDTILRIEATAEGYTSAITTVSVEVLDSLRIEADTDRLSLMEGGDSTELSVSLNRIDAGRGTVTVTINLQEGSELTVMPSSLEFTGTETQIVTVRATSDDDEYMANRSEMLRLTADDYTTATVTVEITDDDPQPIELEVRSSTDLDLVRFSTADIRVSVAVAATLNVVTTGSVRLADGSTSDRSTIDAGETQIQIEAVSIGEGTVTFTVGEGGTADTAVVTVTVIKPTLMISASGVDELEIEARTTEGLTVTVNVAAGDTDTNNVTVTTTVMGNTNAVSVESPVGVSVDTPTMLRVTGLDAGDATLTLTASHPEYKPTSIDVSVSVYLPGVELSVSPPSLRFEQEATRLLMVAVGASTEATITISSSPSSIVSVLSQPFTLMGGESNNSTMIEVSGVGIGRTTLAITASADGYAAETATVIVEVQNRFRIAATPVSLSLVEGASTEISVSLSRIPEGSASVTVTINLQDGSELTVSSPLLTFTDTKTQTVMVRAADDDDKYMVPRSEMLTLTADDYTTAMVTVNITDNDPQPQIVLEVEPAALKIVTGRSTQLSITVSTTAMITITGGDSIARVAAAAEQFTLKRGTENSTQIDVFGDMSGTTTLTIKAEAGGGYVPAMTTVSVEVQDPLRITATPVSVSLVEMEGGDSTQISVNLNRIDAGRDTVTVTINLQEGSELTVSPSSLTFSATKLQTTVTITAIDDSIYRGDREVTVTFEADDYASATVTVTIEEDDPQPVIDLRVTPTATATLNLVRFTTSTEIEVSVAVDARLNIQTRGAVTLADGNAFVSLNLSGKTSTRIGIFGNSVGDGEVGVTASGTGAGTGAMQKMQIVMVTVSTPTLVISEVRPSNINLAARETTVVIVGVSAEAGEPSDVRLMATVLGTENVASVTPTEITVLANTQTMFTVEGLDAGTATLTLTASHRDYISTITEVAVSVYLPPVGLSASTALEITAGTTEPLIIQVNAADATQATLTTSVRMSTIISVMAPAIPTLLDGGDTIINVTGDNQGETDLVIRVEADGYEAAEITVRVRVMPVAALRFRIKVFLEGAQ